MERQLNALPKKAVPITILTNKLQAKNIPITNTRRKNTTLYSWQLLNKIMQQASNASRRDLALRAK